MKLDARRARALIAALFLAAMAFTGGQETRVLEVTWEKAFGGDSACAPVAFRDRVFFLAEDRSLTCLDEEGRFMWRKPLKSRPAPRLFVSVSGLVCVFGRNGEMTAYGANGGLLWTYSGMKGSSPILDPHEGSDGRIFILYENEIVCLAANGAQKWKRAINARGARLIAEDGRGNALVIRDGGVVTPVSPWGDVFPAVETGLNVLGAAPLEGSACALFVPESQSSWKIAAVDFSPSKGDEERTPDILWERGGLPPFAAALSLNGTLYYAGANATLLLLNATDGELLSQSQFYAQGSTAGAAMLYDSGAEGGRVILIAQGFCAAFSLEGDVLWQAAFPKPLVNPVFTEGGFAVSAPRDTVAEGYRVEALPARRRKGIDARRKEYGIFAGKSRDYGNPQKVPFYYFEEIKEKIGGGDLGQAERDISRHLAEILNGDTGNPFSDIGFTSTQRSLAAQLLGEMGSEEARDILLAAARRERDSTAIAGILRGIASLGPEGGRRTLDAVQLILQRQRNAEDVALAACDALYSLALSSCGDEAEEAVAAILSCRSGQYGAAAQKRADEIVEKLLE